MPDTPMYSLAQVSAMTGVPKQTLYAWERRYGFPKGVVNSDRRLLYSSKQVTRIGLLRQCVERGNRIGGLVGLNNGELRRLLRQDVIKAVRLDKLMALIKDLKSNELEVELGLHLLTMGTTLFAEELVAPLMKEVGLRWQEQALPVTAEHLVTASVKSLLVSALRMSSCHGAARRAIFATIEDEHHEIALLAAALIATKHEIKPIYLGPCVPVRELPAAVAKTAADAVIIGSTIADAKDVAEQIKYLRASLPKDVQLLLGGETSSDLREAPALGIGVFPSLSDLDSFLEQGNSNR